MFCRCIAAQEETAISQLNGIGILFEICLNECIALPRKRIE